MVLVEDVREGCSGGANIPIDFGVVVCVCVGTCACVVGAVRLRFTK